MNRLLLILFWVYVLLLPFTSAFSLSGSLFPPFIIAIAILPVLFLAIYEQPMPLNRIFSSEIFPLLFFVLLVWMSYFVNGWGNAKSLNHAIAYSLSILIYYIMMKLVILKLNKDVSFIIGVLKLFTITTSISALFACTEFVLNNFYGIDLGSLVPRGDLQEYDALVIELFQRARGFATESGHFTFMMELFMPICIYYLFFSSYCSWPLAIKCIILFSYFASIVFAASSATFLILPAVFIATAVVYWRRFSKYIISNRRRVSIFVGSVVALMLVLNRYISLYTLILSSVADKFDSNSYDDREMRYRFFYDIFPNQPIVQKLIGVGPSGFRLLGYDESVTIISFYLNVTFELGVLGLFLVLMFIWLVLRQCLKWESNMAPFVFAAVVGGGLHYYIIGNYYYPWFWFVCIFPFLKDYSINRERN
jgi:hypothetical protein